MTTSLIPMLKNPIHCLSLGLGAGLVPTMPGTVGTLLALVFYSVLQNLTLPFYLSFVVMALILGCIFCQYTAQALQRQDPSQIVWDEMVGYWFTMSFAPRGWFWMVLGFILFRFFDIVKPWPIHTIEHKLPGGGGIMLDDMMAGVYAMVILQIFAWLGFTYL